MEQVKRFSLDMQFAKSQVKHDSEGELCFYRDYAALQQKLDEVLAENVALKEANHIAKRILNDEETTVGSLWASSVDKVYVTTPVTDHFYNKLRSEGVEMFADSAYCSRDQHQYVMQFAAQLRTGCKEGGV